MSLATEIKRNKSISHITATLQRPVTKIKTAHDVMADSCKTTKHILGYLLQNISKVDTFYWLDSLYKLPKN
jgi:hypothetical protein